jgi:hypothetical protein
VEDEGALLRQALRLMALAPCGTGLVDHLPPRPPRGAAGRGRA